VSIPYELLWGLALGFSLTVPPGPMNALIAARSVGSFRLGVITGSGAMSADLCLGIAVYLLQSWVDLHSVVRFVYVLGCVVMAFYGYRILAPRTGAPVVKNGQLAAYSDALAVGLSNPFQILWWLTAGLAFAYIGGIVLFVGLFGAIAVWVVAFPYALHAGVRRYPKAGRVVSWVSGGVMVAFAVYFAILVA
jgi:threonine/homoserine/homoserine lactone efflux protein